MSDKYFELEDPIQSRIVPLDAAGKDQLWFEVRTWKEIEKLFENPQTWAGNRHKIANRFFIHVSEPRRNGPDLPDGQVRVTGIEGTGMLLVEGRMLAHTPVDRKSLQALIDDGDLVMPSDLLEVTEIQGERDAYFHLQLPTDPAEGALAAWHLAAVSGSFRAVEASCRQETKTVRLPDGSLDSVVAPGPRQTRHHYTPTAGMRFYTEGDVNLPKPPCLVGPGTQSLSYPDTYEYDTLIMKMY